MRSVAAFVALCVLSCGFAWSQEADMQVLVKDGMKFKWDSTQEIKQTLTSGEDAPTLEVSRIRVSADFDVKEAKDGRLTSFSVKVGELAASFKSGDQEERSCGAELAGREVVCEDGVPNLVDGEANPVPEEAMTVMGYTVGSVGARNFPELAEKRSVKKGDKFSGQECENVLVESFKGGFLSSVAEGSVMNATKDSGELTYEVTGITDEAILLSFTGSSKYVLDGNSGGSEFKGELTVEVNATIKINRAQGLFDKEEIEVRLKARMDMPETNVAVDQQATYKSEYTYGK